MLHFYFARVLAYFAARMVIPAIWWFKPRTLLPLVDFNGWWVKWLLNSLVAAAPQPWNTIAQHFLYVTGKVGDFIQLTLRWYVSVEVRDHVEVLAKAFFTPGGWLMIAQLTLIIFVMIRVWRRMRKRRALHKWGRAERKELTF